MIKRVPIRLIGAVGVCLLGVWWLNSPETPSSSSTKSRNEETSSAASFSEQASNRPPAEDLSTVRENVVSGSSFSASTRPSPPQPTDPSFAREHLRQKYDSFRHSNRALTIGTEDFDLLSIRAVPKDRYSGPLSGVLFERHGLLFVDAGKDARLSMDGTMPVLSRRSNGALGVITGTFIVTLKERQAAPQIAASFGMSTKYFDEALNVVYLAAPSQVDLEELLDSLRTDPSVESVTLEVVQTQKRS